MSYSAKICGFLIILIGGKSVLWGTTEIRRPLNRWLIKCKEFATERSGCPCNGHFATSGRSCKRQKAMWSLCTNW